MSVAKNMLQSTTGRLLTFGILYISEGIPYGFTSIAMVAYMRIEGMSVEQIGTFVAALFLPWSFKWVWAPLIDICKLHRYGGRKAWILCCTLLMIVTLMIIAVVDYSAHFQLLLLMVVVNNFFCATQDVAIDSLAVSTLREDERGRGNGFMFGGQYLGIALGGGGAVFVIGHWGFDISLFYICGMMFLNLLFIVFFIRDPGILTEPGGRKAGNIIREFIGTLMNFNRELFASFFRSGIGPRLGLVFTLLPTGAMALSFAILGTIKVDYGLTITQIAQVSVYNTVCSGLGSLVGGFIGDRFGLRKMIGLSYILSTLPTLYLAVQIATVGLVSVPLAGLFGAIMMHGLCYGMCFGLFAAVCMGITNPAVAATQFTAFMAMSNLTMSYTNLWQGVMAERFGYAYTLYLDALLVILPLLLIPFLKSREEELNDEVEESDPEVNPA